MQLYVLLTPLVTPPAPGEGGKAPLTHPSMPGMPPAAPSLLSLLMGIRPLQGPIVDMLLSVTVAVCSQRLAVEAEWREAMEASKATAAEAPKAQGAGGEGSAEDKGSAEDDGAVADDEGSETDSGESASSAAAPSKEPVTGDREPAAAPAAKEEGAAASEEKGEEAPAKGDASSSSSGAPLPPFAFPPGSAPFHPGFPADGSGGLHFPPDPFSGWMFSAGDLAGGGPAGSGREGRRASGGAPMPPEAAELAKADELLGMVVTALRGAVCAMDPAVSVGAMPPLPGSGGGGTSAGLAAVGEKRGRGSKAARASRGAPEPSRSTASNGSKSGDGEPLREDSAAGGAATLSRLSTLMQSAPIYAQPDIILLVPRLVSPIPLGELGGASMQQGIPGSRSPVPTYPSSTITYTHSDGNCHSST